jgi:hypothetical protein
MEALQDELRRNPKIIPEAMEEMSRRHTFTVPVRRVAKDVVYEGAPMKAGRARAHVRPRREPGPEEVPGSGRAPVRLTIEGSTQRVCALATSGCPEWPVLARCTLVNIGLLTAATASETARLMQAFLRAVPRRSRVSACPQTLSAAFWIRRYRCWVPSGLLRFKSL